jgi:peroxiredoxin-like protein
MNTHVFKVDLQWLNQRKGQLSSPELTTEFEVATPPAFPKGIEGIWSPEHLYTAAVSSCLMTTFLAVAENSKLDFENFSCPATGKLEQVDGKYKMTEVLVNPRLEIVREEDYAKAERVLQKAEAACLISNSITANVIMKPEIVVAKMA